MSHIANHVVTHYDADYGASVIRGRNGEREMKTRPALFESRRISDQPPCLFSQNKRQYLHKGRNRFHEENMTLMTSNACAFKASFKLQRKESVNYYDFSHEPLLYCSQSSKAQFELGSSTSITLNQSHTNLKIAGRKHNYP